jgi:hypothetical protein
MNGGAKNGWKDPWPLLLHHPSRGQGQDHLIQPVKALNRHGRHTRQSVADCLALARWPSQPPPTVAVHPHSGESRFQTPWSLHHHTRSTQENTWEPFFPNPAGGFCTPQAGCPFPASTAGVHAAPAETASKDRPLTLPPPRSVHGGRAL